MQAVFETLFDIVYLITVITLGILMLKKSQGRKQYFLYGLMAVVPVFYVLLYYVWRLRYEVEGRKEITAAVWVLAVLRILLCFMPQNAWTSKEAPLSWGIYRNIPFTLLGIFIIVLFYRSAKEAEDKPFRWLWLTIVLSFACYLPVVLFADACPPVGMLMIPKTCAYVWTVLIGYRAMQGSGMQGK